MKSKSLALSFFIATFFLSSAIPSGSHSLEIGSEAPSISLSPEAGKNIGSLDGKRVIVNFWSAEDPSSRIANRKLSRLAESDSFSDTRFVSVCIDSDKSIASEIARIDRISDNVVSLGKEDVTSDVLEDFQTATGCRTFIIDRFGILKQIIHSGSEIPDILS
ncbi:MAG: peroxiredoxin family protein [Muribaculaceae bacterium]|nr:peroxiredoxin family protein [Muribaculaceae bacterium]